MGTGRPQPGALVELLKPITWFPPMWAFLCGAVSSGQGLIDRPWLLVAGVLLAGPLVCGASQVVNDWFDREVDAINEPERPIPSGRVPGSWGLLWAIVWTALSALWGAALGFWVGIATALVAAGRTAPRPSQTQRLVGPSPASVMRGSRGSPAPQCSWEQPYLRGRCWWRQASTVSAPTAS